jgi:hypothetical protein
VIVHAPGTRFALRRFSVISVDRFDLLLETTEPLPHLSPATPLVLSALRSRSRLDGTVVTALGRTGLHVRLAPLPERRAHRRVELRLDVEVDPFGHRHHRTVQCTTRDLGEGGLSLWVPERLKAGRRAVASIRVAAEPAILAMVEILDSTATAEKGLFATRLKFTTLPWDARQRLRRLLALQDEARPDLDGGATLLSTGLCVPATHGR